MIPTSFSVVYDSFLSKITDDMYLQLTEQETEALLKEMLIVAVHKFEFPRVCLDYEYVNESLCKTCANYENCQQACKVDKGWIFIYPLTQEEINIISTYMIVEWLGQQLASIENVRMKYSGSDFKFTSQANHMQKILQMKKDYEREGFHLQRLYKRRIRDIDGIYRSTIPSIMEDSLGFQIAPRPGADGGCGCRYYQAIKWKNFEDFEEEVAEDDACDCDDD